MTDNQPKARGQFGSNLGFIFAAAGSAVGLGNIWKFPRMAYNYGGGSFILIYVVIVVLLGVTAMLTELALGRKSKSNASAALGKIKPKWAILGKVGVFTSFVILSYYSHVAGWVLKYAIGYLVTPSKIFADPTMYLMEDILGQSAFPWQGAIIFPAIIMAITVFIVVQGVNKGIEKANKVLMPALLIMLGVMAVRGMTMPDAGEGIRYLTTIDLSLITPSTFIVALGQAFYSLSLGVGVMVTYGSYVSSSNNLVKDTFTICSLDTLVAFVAGFAIIPIAFSAGIEISGSSGSAGFGFISLAHAFASMPAGSFFGFLFYFLMFFAAITSSISLLMGVSDFITEEYHLNKKMTATVIGIAAVCVGMLYTLSQGNMDLKLPWIDANGLSYPIVGDWMENLTDKVLMPLGSLLICIFAGWVWGADNIAEEIKKGNPRFKLQKAYTICVKYIAPGCIIVILLSGFGFIKF